MLEKKKKKKLSFNKNKRYLFLMCLQAVYSVFYYITVEMLRTLRVETGNKRLNDASSQINQMGVKL